MAWIKVVEEDEADESLRGAYDRLARARGKVANILKVQSLRPKALEAHAGLYAAVMFEAPGLTREEREMLAVAVSSANQCAYCVAHHAEALLHYWKDRARVQALLDLRSQDGLGLSEREIGMLRFALRLTRHPAETGEAEVTALRSLGLSDADILDVVQVVAYFNFVNRMALGLGVECSEEETRGYRY